MPKNNLPNRSCATPKPPEEFPEGKRKFPGRFKRRIFISVKQTYGPSHHVYANIEEEPNVWIGIDDTEYESYKRYYRKSWS